MSEQTPNTAERLAQIEARANSATGGPWIMTTQGGIESVNYRGPGEVSDSVASARNHADWEFIAAARSDIPFLLERLRTVEVERGAIKAARDEVQEKIAFLRKGCQNMTEDQLRQKIGAVDSAEWKLGYYWNDRVDEYRKANVRAEVAQRSAEAERDAALAKLATITSIVYDGKYRRDAEWVRLNVRHIIGSPAALSVPVVENTEEAK